MDNYRSNYFIAAVRKLITKFRIESVLTGEITTHTHPGGNGNLALGETNTTAYRGDRGKTAYDHSQVAHAPSDATNVNSMLGYIIAYGG